MAAPPATMLSSFSVLGKSMKVNLNKASIDNLVFWLHYRFTFALLIICTILVSSREYIGEHIRCIVDKGVPEKVINTFCFFTSTFTVTRHYNESSLALGYIPHAGVGPTSDEDEIKHHNYYQWVPFMLFGQAIMFYLPHRIWRKAEGGRIQALMDGLYMASMSYADQDMTVNGKVVPSKKTLEAKMGIVKTDFLMRLHATRTWSTWLISCEIMNFVNVILQALITNRFLGGSFWGLGPSVMGHPDWNSKIDPLDHVFPKMTKCQFHKYGPSGSIQKHDALCVMALNVINEKIYTFLWFWFLFLFIASLGALIWRLITVVLHSRSAKFSVMVFSNASPGKLQLKDVLAVTNRCYFADWLFLYYLAKNMDGFVFKNLFISLAEEMDLAAAGTSGTSTPPYSDEKSPMMGRGPPNSDHLENEDEKKVYPNLFDDSTLKLKLSESDDDLRKNKDE